MLDVALSDGAGRTGVRRPYGRKKPGLSFAIGAFSLAIHSDFVGEGM